MSSQVYFIFLAGRGKSVQMVQIECGTTYHLSIAFLSAYYEK